MSLLAQCQDPNFSLSVLTGNLFGTSETQRADQDDPHYYGHQ